MARAALDVASAPLHERGRCGLPKQQDGGSVERIMSKAAHVPSVSLDGGS